MSAPLRVRLTGTTTGTLDAVIVHVHLTDVPPEDEEEEAE